MTRRMTAMAVAFGAACLAMPATGVAGAQGTNPVLVMRTQKGAIEIELFQADAPKSVAHILDLVTGNFYRGLRFHRVESSLAQFGDPGTRDMSRIAYWGRGSSGHPIGVAEISRKHTHQRGTVALAHSGSAAAADSQLYIMKRASPSLDGKFTIIGRVTSGMDIVDTIVKADRILNITVKGAAPAS
jgi:cyclophilin family peptidyl-prolyl cis-trans isomerase